jgi:DNA-nicking Smr family endonuclease
MSTVGGRKGKRLTGEDIELWEGVTRSVKPIRVRKRAIEADEAPPPAKPAKKSASRPAAPPAAPLKAPAPKSPPAIAPIEKRLKQKIARGSQTIDARLDLHGHSQAEAHDALYRFLRGAQSRGGRLVLVITGKGGRGASGRGEGVLKRAVPLWLALPEFRALVIGYDTAAISHGGEGALYVRVRKLKDLS